MSLSSMPLTIKRSLAAELGDKVAQLGLVNGIVTPESVDDVWEWYVKEGLATTDPDPSWGKIWDTSVHLSQHLSRNPTITCGANVADLGCGLGLCGLVAVGTGAKSVLFLDQEVFPLQMAMESAAINGFEVGGTESSAVVSAALCVGGNLPVISSHRLADVVLASDILYDLRIIPDIAKAVLQLLSRDGGRVLIADPMKGRAPGCRKAFVDEVKILGATQADEIVLPTIPSREDCVLLDIIFPGGLK